MLLAQMCRLEKDRNKKGGDTKKLVREVAEAAKKAYEEEAQRQGRFQEEVYF